MILKEEGRSWWNICQQLGIVLTFWHYGHLKRKKSRNNNSNNNNNNNMPPRFTENDNVKRKQGHCGRIWPTQTSRIAVRPLHETRLLQIWVWTPSLKTDVLRAGTGGGGHRSPWWSQSQISHWVLGLELLSLQVFFRVIGWSNVLILEIESDTKIAWNKDLVGGFLQPTWKICLSNMIVSPNFRGKKYPKMFELPPTF